MRTHPAGPDHNRTQEVQVMAEKFVIRDADESKVRWIAEPRFLARLRRLKGVWNAFKFLAGVAPN